MTFDAYNSLPVSLRSLICRCFEEPDIDRAARHIITIAERLGWPVFDHALFVVVSRAAAAGALFTEKALAWIKADGECALWLAFPAEMTQAVTIRADERRGAGRFSECARIERELQERLGARVAA